MAFVFQTRTGQSGLPRPAGFRTVGRTGGGGGRVPSVEFDNGTILHTNAKLTAASGPFAGRKGTCSVFWRLRTADVAQGHFVANLGTRFQVGISGDERFNVTGSRSPDGVAVLTNTSNVRFPDTVWHHGLVSWDVQNDLSHMYVDDADVGNTTILLNDGSSLIDYDRNDWAVGGNPNTFANINAHVAELIFHDDYVDITQEVNRRMFLRADGRPAFTDSGRAPFGASPWIYLAGAADDWQTNNRGRGGNFSVVLEGALLNSGSAIPAPRVGD